MNFAITNKYTHTAENVSLPMTHGESSRAKICITYVHLCRVYFRGPGGAPPPLAMGFPFLYYRVAPPLDFYLPPPIKSPLE